MKNNIAIKVENLGKRYEIGKEEKYLTLGDQLMRLPKKILSKKKNDEFWALKNVNFEVKKGEILGVIGPNGAGKSTLLKILSRITEPTTGKAILKGRVASMLEVGTGFHQELTGRENIYISGAILGMTKKEIKEKFEEIVEFSGLEKFLDTPVKRYSSGMRVRLAFAVAAHLEPEILLVDEVLAVGDAEFQKRSLGKMEEVTKGEGRTIIFVSHNIEAIKHLTSRCMLFKNGKMIKIGETKSIISSYINNKSLGLSSSTTNVKSNLENFEIKEVCFDEDRLLKGFNKPLRFKVRLNITKKFQSVGFGFGIKNSTGARVATFEKTINISKLGEVEVLFILKKHHLPPGAYFLSIGFSYKSSPIVFQEDIIIFKISNEGVENTSLNQKGGKLGTYHIPTVKIK